MGKQHNEGPTTQFYDIIYKKYLGKRTEKDVELIFDAIKNKIRKPFSEVKVLDIGCGSGRLSLLLLKKDITAYGIDISKIMINNFKKKLEKNRISAKLFNEDFLTTRKLNINYYDCIICFFNTFCEIALDGNSALKVLEKMKKLLTKNGIIILEMSNPRAFDPSNLVGPKQETS